jgi:transcriptional regulator with XRE-family HTH domain
METFKETSKETSKETVSKILNKIRDIRKQKGYSNEAMAMDLGMSTSAYNKLERMESSVSLERFVQIIEVLNVPYSEFFDLTAKSIYQQDLKDNSIGHYEVQTLHQENREVYEKLIAAKDEQIALLKDFVGK